jgi:predicted dehydrogenase
MPSRREFLETLTYTSAGLLAAGYTATARGYAANETLGIGLIGVGGRCNHLRNSLPKLAGVRVAAVCDVYDVNLEKAKARAGSDVFATKDYAELLARPEIDAVLIATPDHLHVPITVAACAAGKDVYVEKPLTHDLSEGQAVIDAQNQHRRIVQVGMQQRSMPHIQEAYEIVKAGTLGPIRKVHLAWNRNSPRGRKTGLGIDPAKVDWKRFVGTAPEQPFDEYRFANWRWFWDFGGGIFTDLMVHWIDVGHWFLGVDHPAVAASIGDHFMNADLWETPDTVQTLLRYPDREAQAYFEGTFVNARNGAMIEFMGTEASLYIDRGRYELHPERKKTVEYKEKLLGSGPRGADFYDQPDGELVHLGNWLECIRSRQKPVAPAEAGVSAASAAHLANQALRSGQVAKWQDS